MIKLVAGVFAIGSLISIISISGMSGGNESSIEVAESAFVKQCIASVTELTEDEELLSKIEPTKKLLLSYVKLQIPKKCRCIDQAMTNDLDESEAGVVRQMAALDVKYEFRQRTASREERKHIREEAKEEGYSILSENGYTQVEAAEFLVNLRRGRRACFNK